jgi:hypothetical protein
MVIQRSGRVTLRATARISAVLSRFRAVLVFLGVAAGIWLAYVVLSPSTPSSRALLPLSVLLWVALGIGMGSMLAVTPPDVAVEDRFTQRMGKRLLQLGYGLAVVLALLLAVFAVGFSVRALQIALG